MTDSTSRPVALITGASSGIGAAVAHTLISTHDLVLVARREDRLSALQKALLDHEPTARVMLRVQDVCSGDESELIAAIVDEFDRLDAVVVNAGVFATANALDYQDADARAMFDLNVYHPMRLIAASLPALRKRQGVIVPISSIAAESGFPGCGVYAASKAALEGFARSLREEEREYGVRVSIVAPGPTDTEVWPEDCPFDRSKMSSARDIAGVIANMVRQPGSVSIERTRITPVGGSL